MRNVLNADDVAGGTGALTDIDVAIFGTGPAGIVALQELAQKGRKILVAEAGSATRRHISPENFIAFEESKNVDFSRLGVVYELGGASNYWAGRCATLEPNDISKKNGWPFEWEALKSEFRRARQMLGLKEAPSSVSIEEEFGENTPWQRFLEQSGFSLKLFRWGKKNFNAGDHLLDVLGAFPNVTLLQGARLLELKKKDYANHVSHALLVSTDGTKFQLNAKKYLLALGGVETPRILLNSTEFPGGLGNKTGNVGRYFSSHPKADLGRVILQQPVATSNALFRIQTVGGQAINYGLGLDAAAQGDGGKLNHYFQFQIKHEINPRKMLEFFKYKSSEARLTNKRSFWALVGSMTRFHLFRAASITAVRFAANTMVRLGFNSSTTSALTVRIFLDQRPSRKNRVSLAQSIDPYGYRKAKIEWSFSAEDDDELRSFIDNLATQIEKAGLGQFAPYERSDILAQIGGLHSHFMGTTRMGEDATNSVVNEFGQLHDCPDVFISGPSLFSSYGFANPMWTLSALALRVAKGLDASLAPYDR